MLDFILHNIIRKKETKLDLFSLKRNSHILDFSSLSLVKLYFASFRIKLGKKNKILEKSEKKLIVEII